MVMNKINYLKYFIAIIIPLILIATGVTTVVVSTVSLARAEQTVSTQDHNSNNKTIQEKIISEDTLIPLGLVITIIGLVASVVVNFTESRIHRNNSDIHHTTGELKELFIEKDCVKEIKESIEKLESSVNEIKIEMARNFAKLEKSINGK